MKECPDCGEITLKRGQTVCDECQEAIDYLDKFIRKEDAKGRFCRECNKPVGKYQQLCDEHKEANKLKFARKYAKEHAKERAEYTSQYRKRIAK